MGIVCQESSEKAFLRLRFYSTLQTVVIIGIGCQLVVHVLFLTDFSEQVYVYYRHPAFNTRYLHFSSHLDDV